MTKRTATQLLSACVSLLLLSGCMKSIKPILEPPPLEIVPRVAKISAPDNRFVFGSSAYERAEAYGIDQQAYDSDITLKQHWYDYEIPRQERHILPFEMSLTPITNFQYAAFLKANPTYPVPHVDAVTWQTYGLQHPFERTKKYQWDVITRTPPLGRENHPVVLVNITDAQAYAHWLSEVTGDVWRLPSEEEWELGGAGAQGLAYPWGQILDADAANTADNGPFDTLPVGSFPHGASPFGLLDMAGQVYEWTKTPGEKGRYTVKGGSWDDRGCGICRTSARHHRPADMKHILIGFRLVRVMD